MRVDDGTNSESAATPRWPKSAKVTAAVLSLALVAAAVFAIAMTASLSGQRDDKQAELEGTQEALAASEQSSRDNADDLSGQIDGLKDDQSRLQSDLDTMSRVFELPTAQVLRPRAGDYSGSLTGSDCRGFKDNEAACQNFGGSMSVAITDDGQTVSLVIPDLATIPLGSLDGLASEGSAKGSGFYVKCSGSESRGSNVSVRLVPDSFDADPVTGSIGPSSFLMTLTINWPGGSSCLASRLTLSGVLSAS